MEDSLLMLFNGIQDNVEFPPMPDNLFYEKGGISENPFANVGKTKKQVSKYSDKQKDKILAWAYCWN